MSSGFLATGAGMRNARITCGSVACVRKVPPERRWVPGYWTEASGGHQWVSGFWAPQAAAEVEYVEPPPESLEEGPSAPAPSEEYFWVPGCWTYNQNAYAWRSGYWRPYVENWVYVPARYVWSPLGCVYVDEYWDYGLATRGQLFAPVYYSSPVYMQPYYHYRPSWIIDVARLHIHLFANPRYHHYYFGDYFAPQYLNRGFYSSYDYYRYRPGYASLYNYYHHHYRHLGIDYGHRVRSWHDYYVRHEDHRPPHTWNDQVRYAQRHQGRALAEQALMGQTLSEAVSRPGPGRARYVQLAGEQQQRSRQSVQDIRRIADQRVTMERPRGQGGPAEGNARLRGRGALQLPPAEAVTRVQTPPRDRPPSAQVRDRSRNGRGEDGQIGQRGRELARDAAERAQRTRIPGDAQGLGTDNAQRARDTARTMAERARQAAEGRQRAAGPTGQPQLGGSNAARPDDAQRARDMARTMAERARQAAATRQGTAGPTGQQQPPGNNAARADGTQRARDTARAMAEQARQSAAARQRATGPAIQQQQPGNNAARADGAQRARDTALAMAEQARQSAAARQGTAGPTGQQQQPGNNPSRADGAQRARDTARAMAEQARQSAAARQLADGPGHATAAARE